jgi:hypothetical protein
VVSRLRSFRSLRRLILYSTIFDLPRRTIDILVHANTEFVLFISSLICRCELIGSICMSFSMFSLTSNVIILV